MRTGVSEGLLLEAIAAAWGVDVATTRRAALFLGDLTAVATLAAAGGAAAVAGATPRPFVPLLPMLAEIADDFPSVLAAHGGRTALEYKYDGARIQLHRAGDRVQVWTRRLSDVTRSLPDVVEITRRDLSGEPFILDGEVVALDAAGRPLPFQELMRRFRRVHGVEALVREMPLALHFFDCLMAGGRSLIDEPYERRWEALTAVTGGRYLAERRIVTGEAEAGTFRDAALAAGHEGVMAKDLASTYEPGGRGKRWFKRKAAETVDCVIVAADRGSGRRRGWLSNYHLAVRDGDAFADVGKTFKGFTDRQFVEMTERLWALATSDDGYTVRVRPEVVVEVAHNEIQKSPTYPSGLALRSARLFAWSLKPWTHTVTPMADPYPPPDQMDAFYSNACPWVGRVRDFQVATPDGGREFDWNWKAAYNHALYTVRPFVYFHCAAGTRRVVVDGVEPMDTPADSIQCFIFDELYRKTIHRDAETLGMEICLPVWKHREFIDAHLYDHTALTTVLLVTTEEPRLEDLLARQVASGAIA